jgi:HNH endonuclease
MSRKLAEKGRQASRTEVCSKKHQKWLEMAIRPKFDYSEGRDKPMQQGKGGFRGDAAHMAKMRDARGPCKSIPLFSRIARLSMPEPNTGCWIWIGYCDDEGYGHIGVKKEDGHRTTRPAHVVSYEIAVGNVPLGLELDHICRVTSCVNPHHLEPVAHRENLMRGNTLAAQNVNKTHCIHGHEFTQENTRITTSKHRRCRICDRILAYMGYYRKRNLTPPNGPNFKPGEKKVATPK